MKFSSEKLLSWLPVAFFVTGALLYTIFSRLDSDIGFIGLIFVGAGIVLIGMRPVFEIINNQLLGTEKISSNKIRMFLPYLMHAITLTLVGVGLMVFGGIVFSGWGDSTITYLNRRPGILLLFLGFLGETYALSVILKPHSGSKKLQDRFRNFGRMISGGLLFCFSSLILASGLIEIISPTVFIQLRDSFISRLFSIL